MGRRDEAGEAHQEEPAAAHSSLVPQDQLCTARDSACSQQVGRSISIQGILLKKSEGPAAWSSDVVQRNYHASRLLRLDHHSRLRGCPTHHFHARPPAPLLILMRMASTCQKEPCRLAVVDTQRAWLHPTHEVGSNQAGAAGSAAGACARARTCLMCRSGWQSCRLVGSSRPRSRIAPAEAGGLLTAR